MLKRFWPYTERFRKEMILSCVCVILECAFEILIPMVMADLVDIGVANKDRSFVLQKSALMLTYALLSLLLGVLYAKFVAVASQGFGAELRKAEYEKVQGYSFSNLDKFPTSSLVTRLTSDVTIMQMSVTNGLRPLVRGPIMLAMGLFLAFRINRELAMVFLVSIPVLGASLAVVVYKLRPMYGKMQKAVDKVNLVVQENLRAMRVVKAYARGEYESEKFKDVNIELQTSAEKAFGYAVMNAPIFQAVMYATIICLLWFGNGLIQVGGMQIGQLTGFLSYVLLILNSLMMISGVFLLISRSITSGSRILEIMDEEPDIADGESREVIVENGSIEFKNVYFKYYQDAEEYVLSDINIAIKAGQTIGIIGGTGSAKSSMVQLIPRLYDVTAGQLFVDGRDVREYSVSHLRGAIAMVLQNNTLFTGTVRENLLWGNPNATQKDLDKACAIAAADKVIDKLPQGYNTFLGQGGSNVSGGQKQRLCIARALLKNSRVLIFDDSTSAVDTATESQIQAALAKELPNVTKLIIAQRISSVEKADQIIILENGKINDIGTHDTLLASSPIYQDIFYAQQKGAKE